MLIFVHLGIQSPDRRPQTIGRIPQVAHSTHQRLPGSPPGKKQTTIILDVSYQFEFVSPKGSDNAFARTARGHEGFAKGSRVYAGLAPAAD
jgi:hypothetical protein